MILFDSFTHIWILLLFMYLGLCSGIIFFSTSFLLEKTKIILLKPRENKTKNDTENYTKNNDESISNEVNKTETYNAKNINEENISKPLVQTINIEDSETQKIKIKNCKIEDCIEIKSVSNNDINKENKNRTGRKILSLFVFKKVGNGKENFKNNPSKKETTKNNKKNCKDNFHREQHSSKRSYKKAKDNEGKKAKEKRKNNFKLLILKLSQYFKKITLGFQRIKNRVINTSFITIKILVFLLVVTASYLINLHLNLGYLRIGFIIVFILFFCLAKTLIKLLANFIVNFYNYFKRKYKKQN